MTRRPPLPPALKSAHVKLQRANLHKRIAKREAVRLFNGHPNPTFRIDPQGDQDLTVGAINRANIVYDGEGIEIPDSFAARFGDAIHNYRCVLDHIAWQLVCHGRSWPLPSEWAENQVQFPIYNTKRVFDNNVRTRRLVGVDNAAVSYIKTRHGYVRGQATNNGLLAISALSNNDKHRTLHVFLNFFRTLETDITIEGAVPVTWENPPVRPEVKKDAVVTCFSYRVLDADFKMHMNLRPEVQIVIEDGRDFSEILEGITVEVTEILYAPEIIAAVS